MHTPHPVYAHSGNAYADSAVSKLDKHRSVSPTPWHWIFGLAVLICTIRGPGRLPNRGFTEAPRMLDFWIWHLPIRAELHKDGGIAIGITYKDKWLFSVHFCIASRYQYPHILKLGDILVQCKSSTRMYSSHGFRVLYWTLSMHAKGQEDLAVDRRGCLQALARGI